VKDAMVGSLNFIGGEKGGVGKSVAARVLAQYFIDKGQSFTGYDTDRSHASFRRFYEDFASPVIVDSFDGLDRVVSAFEDAGADVTRKSVIVDLAAQTAAPLAKWIKDSDLLAVMAQLGVAVNFWHLSDGGRDSVDLLDRLINTYGAGPNYFVVRNLGRATDFSLLDASPALLKARALGAQVFDLDALHETSMRKIDGHNASFWAAVNSRTGPDSLGMLERQRVRIWLRNTYASLDRLPL
jgi:hypothetical protein